MQPTESEKPVYMLAMEGYLEAGGRSLKKDAVSQPYLLLPITKTDVGDVTFDGICENPTSDEEALLELYNAILRWTELAEEALKDE